MTTFYDALETRSREARQAALMAALPQQILHAQQASPAFAGILAGVDAAGVTSRAALATPRLLARGPCHVRRRHSPR